MLLILTYKNEPEELLDVSESNLNRLKLAEFCLF